MAPAERLRIQVVYGPQQAPADVVDLELQPGATVAMALEASGLLTRHALERSGLRLGVWGRVCGAGQLLRDRDRVEIYRPLQVDPKEARRQRYQAHRDAAGGNTRGKALSGSRTR